MERPRAANARLPLCLRLRASGRAPAGGGGRVPCGQSACVVGARAHSLAHLPRRAGHKLGWPRRVRGVAWRGWGFRPVRGRDYLENQGFSGGIKRFGRVISVASVPPCAGLAALIRGEGLRACPS